MYFSLRAQLNLKKIKHNQQGTKCSIAHLKMYT